MNALVGSPLRTIRHLSEQSTEWYSSQVERHIQEGGSVDSMKVNLNMSIIKPLSANSIVSAADYLRNSPSVIINGFNKAGTSVSLSC